MYNFSDISTYLWAVLTRLLMPGPGEGVGVEGGIQGAGFQSVSSAPDLDGRDQLQHAPPFSFSLCPH